MLQGTLYLQKNDGTYEKVSEGFVEATTYSDSESDVNFEEPIRFDWNKEFTCTYTMSRAAATRFMRAVVGGWTAKGHVRKKQLMKICRGPFMYNSKGWNYEFFEWFIENSYYKVYMLLRYEQERRRTFYGNERSAV